MRKGILLCCHGSRSNEGIRDTNKLLRILKKTNKNYTVKIGYLEIKKPTIKNQLEFFLKKKFNNLLIVPGMIFSGNHVTKDIPKIINASKKKFKKLPKIKFTPPLIKSKNFFDILQNNLMKNLKKIKNKKKTKIIIVASNTVNTYAKSQINFLAKKIVKKNKLNSYKTLLITLNKDNIKKILNKSLSNYKTLILPIFLFRGNLLENLKSVLKSNMKANQNNFILSNHINNYKKVVSLMNDMIKK